MTVREVVHRARTILCSEAAKVGYCQESVMEMLIWACEHRGWEYREDNVVVRLGREVDGNVSIDENGVLILDVIMGPDSRKMELAE